MPQLNDQISLEELIRKLSSELIQVQRFAAEQAGLNYTDLMALFFIREGHDQTTPKALAEHLGLTSGATTILLNRLDTRGYIVRHPHPSDRRGVLLSLGPAAKSDKYLAVRDRLYALNSQIYASLSPDESRIVRRFLRDLLSNTHDALREIRGANQTTKAQDEA
jgi:DNA-binding MarR family transcriptional regulator